MCTRSAAGIHASCVFIACKQEGVPRTFNEFVPLANAPKKEIGKCFKFIIRHLGVKLDGSVHASKFLHRFCNQLGMNHQDTKAATEIINAAVPKDSESSTTINAWDGKNPTSIIGAVIYIVSNLPKVSVSRSIGEIANVTHVADATIRSTYRDMYPSRHQLVPSWFASAEEIDRLPVPQAKK
mmetsp:Transcript_17117/g.40859  ORF Transcript_17117/g.40859 Transcript_17117/m.40859 type:complete len:182 (-) Transcript_17117:119-664(-)